MFRYAFLFVMALALTVYFIHKYQTTNPKIRKISQSGPVINAQQNVPENDIKVGMNPANEYDDHYDEQNIEYSSPNDAKLARKLQYERDIEINEYCEVICQQLGCYSGVNDLKLRNNCHCIQMNSQLCNVYDNI